MVWTIDFSNTMKHIISIASLAACFLLFVSCGTAYAVTGQRTATAQSADPYGGRGTYGEYMALAGQWRSRGLNHRAQAAAAAESLGSALTRSAGGTRQSLSMRLSAASYRAGCAARCRESLRQARRADAEALRYLELAHKARHKMTDENAIDNNR